MAQIIPYLSKITRHHVGVNHIHKDLYVMDMTSDPAIKAPKTYSQNSDLTLVKLQGQHYYQPRPTEGGNIRSRAKMLFGSPNSASAPNGAKHVFYGPLPEEFNMKSPGTFYTPVIGSHIISLNPYLLIATEKREESKDIAEVIKRHFTQGLPGDYLDTLASHDKELRDAIDVFSFTDLCNLKGYEHLPAAGQHFQRIEEQPITSKEEIKEKV